MESNRLHSALKEKVQAKLAQFPSLFDKRLLNGFDKISANAPTNFLTHRSFRHLKTILITQFFLQHKMEQALERKEEQKPLFIKLFQQSTRLCCAISYHSCYGFSQRSAAQPFPYPVTGNSKSR